MYEDNIDSMEEQINHLKCIEDKEDILILLSWEDNIALENRGKEIGME